jgi:hypothetical protein
MLADAANQSGRPVTTIIAHILKIQIPIAVGEETVSSSKIELANAREEAKARYQSGFRS